MTSEKTIGYPLRLSKEPYRIIEQYMKQYKVKNKNDAINKYIVDAKIVIELKQKKIEELKEELRKKAER